MYSINHEDPFLPTGHPLLSKVAEPVSLEEIYTEAFKRLIFEMKNLGNTEQQHKTKFVLMGLAATQIGIMKRIILVDVGADGKGEVSDLRAYINPKIISYSEEESTWYEGCYSLRGYAGIIKRPDTVVITALNEDGVEIKETHSGYVGRIFQHETDHLDGKMLVCRVHDHKNLHRITNDDMYEYRNKQKWRQWKNHASKDEYETLKKSLLP
ncbi:hypothetical protein COB11_06740 [Candidatus Aerophobetes bacterium]|uniref:Peptide deformylase n=1 Tax=Aerophobetes bacterium TaxID=2030807 RepID=A0A2A4YDC6_UNCAE|nr:MAG: hypothetical protein COB11_06740 [Candidatus Aerophobetes bacterium]